MELRPLGFGEIFDRAITLYIRNIVPFAGIVAVVILPLAVVQYIADLGSQPQWDAIFKALEHPGRAPAPVPASTIFSSPSSAAALGLLLLIIWLVWPFALNACAVGVAQLYRQRPVDFRTCYAASLRRWPSVLGLLFVELFIFLLWYVAFVIGMVVVVLLAAALMRAWVPAGVIAIALAGFVFLVAMLSLAPLFVALTFAMNSIVIEELPVFRAIALGFTRVFNRNEIWRALLFAISAGAILIGASAITGGIAIIAVLFHQMMIEVFITSVFRAAIAPFSIVLLAVYYFDVRIRREGLDLESELERLTTPLVA